VIHFNVERLTVSRAILLESNTTILLEDCVIKQADETFDNVVRSANLNPNGNGDTEMPSDIPILENIKIIGVGKANIIGPDVNASSGGTPLVGDAYGFRTWQICIVRTNGVEISNISFTKTRCWCITFELCEYVSVHDLSIRSNVKNGDGIDFRVGCKHCEVYDMFACTLDDAVACTALGTLAESAADYCFKPTWKLWPSLINASPSSLDIEKISVRNIDFSQTVNTDFNGGHGMICLSAYGSKVHNVSIDNFKEEYVGDNNNDGLIKIYHGYGSGYTAGDLNTIRMNHIVCTHFPYTLQVTGGIVEDVRANKLVNNASGGSTVSVSSGNVIGTNVIVTNS
jgi:polygalacturonase